MSPNRRLVALALAAPLVSALLALQVPGDGPKSEGGGPSDVPPPDARLEFRLAEESPGPGLTPMVVSDYAGMIYLHSEVALSSGGVEFARASRGEFGQPVVELVLTDAGFAALKQLFSVNLRKRLAVLIDGQLLMAPVIAGPLEEQIVVVEGVFTVEEARELARRLSGE